MSSEGTTDNVQAQPYTNQELVAMEVARLATVIESLTERIRSLEDDNVRLKHHLRWNSDAN